MTETLDVFVFQMTSVDDVSTNLKWVLDSLQSIDSRQNIDLVCLPENCLYMRLKDGEKIQGFNLNDSIFLDFSKVAQDRNCYLHLGSVPLQHKNGLYNSSIWITPEGDIQSHYQKIHLFDIQLLGRPPFRESDVFTHGDNPSIFQLRGWRIGESICYDVRFSELYHRYARHDVDILLVPAAFLVETGKAHWEILLRARAIESQAFVLASAQTGVHQNASGERRETYGHSMVVGPWGDIKSILPSGAGILYCQLNKTQITKVRQQIPMKAHRRLF